MILVLFSTYPVRKKLGVWYRKACFFIMLFLEATLVVKFVVVTVKRIPFLEDYVIHHQCGKVDGKELPACDSRVRVLTVLYGASQNQLKWRIR